MASSDNKPILVPVDRRINKEIIQFLVDNEDKIAQLSVIVIFDDEDSSLMRSSMNNMEKLWFWEKHKAELLK